MRKIDQVLKKNQLQSDKFKRLAQFDNKSNSLITIAPLMLIEKLLSFWLGLAGRY